MFYILIISPMDSGFVGPFETRDAASEYTKTTHHDTYVMTAAEYAANVAAFGQPDFVQEPST